MKWLGYLAALAGAALVVALIVHTGYRNILDLLALAGWNLLWLLPYRLLPVGLDAYGWRVLLAPRDPRGRGRLPVLLWIALVREGVGRLLPVASIGAEIVGIRLLILRGIDGAAATASVILEVILSLISQYLFTALCALLLILILQDNHLTNDLLLALGLTFPIPLLMLFALRRARFFQRIERLAERLLGGRSRLTALFGGASNLDAEIQLLMTRHKRLVAGVFWQFVGMLSGSFEVWLALRLLGHPVSPTVAIALESATLALRHMAFFVPVGLGVQEVGLVALGELLGLSGDTALTLSLVKRMRELLLGVPALISWQIYEGWQLRHRASAEPVSRDTSP